MLLAARQSMLTGGGPTAKSYVQDGLIAMWDGIENAGWGVHSTTTNTWVDLLGNYDAVQRQDSGWHWEKDAYVGTQQNGHGFVVPIEFTNWLTHNYGNFTGEICFNPSVKERMVCLGNYGHQGSLGVTFEYASHRNDSYRVFFSLQPDTSCEYVWSTLERHCCTICSTGTGNNRNNKSYFVDGRSLHMNYYDYQYVGSPIIPNYSFLIGGDSGRTSMSILGELCFARFYSRALTAAEIASNHAIDKIRFNLSD